MGGLLGLLHEMQDTTFGAGGGVLKTGRQAEADKQLMTLS